MPWEIPITVDGLEYPVRFDTENEPTQEDIDEAVRQITSQRTPAPSEDKPAFDLSDTLAATGRAFTALGTTVPASLSQAWEGLSNPWKRSAGYKEQQQNMLALQREMQAADEAAAASGDASSTSAAIREATPSLGFSVSTLAPSLAAGGATALATRNPKAAAAAAAGTSALVAYRAAGAQFLDDAKERIDAFFQEKLGRAPSEQEQEEAYQELLPLARKFGAAEAGPEALGNLALGGAGKYIRRALGGKAGIIDLASSALGKVTGAKAVAAGAGGLASEIATEAVTKVEQDRLQQQFEEGVMQGKSPDEVELPSRAVADYTAGAKEVAPATTAMTALMGAAGLAPTVAARGMRALRSPQQPDVTPPIEGEPAQDVAENVAAANMGETAVATPQAEGIPVSLDGVNHTVTLPPDSTISPDVLATLDPDSLRALADRGDIRLEQVIAPTEVDTSVLNDNLAVSSALAPQTVAAMKEIAAEDTLSPAAVTTAQETPVAPAESDGGSLGQSPIAEGGSSPAVTEITVPQTTDVSSPEIGAAADPFAPAVEAVAPAAGAAVSPATEAAKPGVVTFVHTTKTAPGKGQTSGYYPGTYSYESESGFLPSMEGNKFVGSLPEESIYTLQDSDQLKKDAAQAGFGFHSGNGNAEIEYLKSLGYKAMRRGSMGGVEIIVFDTKDANFQPASGQPDLGAGAATTPQGAIESPTTPLAGKSAEPPTPPTNAPAPQIVETGVREKPAKGTRRRKAVTPSSSDQLPGETRSVEQAPLRPKFEVGETVTFKVNGQPVIGTIKRVSGGGNATVAYNWNGKKEQEIVLRTSEIQRPVLAIAEAPNYKYTQEQNTRKAARVGLPTEPGVTVNAASVITSALERIASDTAMPPMLRAVARALQRQNYDGVDLRIEADGRRWYAGYYLNDNGITEIGINLRNVGRGQLDAVSVFLHEALHHVTLAKVRNPQGDVETEAVQALDTLRKRIRAYAGMQQQATKFSYELGTVDEFITALFTRPDFQDFIAGIPDTFTPGTPGSKFRSVLSEIFRLIAQLVTGQKVQKGGMLDQAFASTLALFETPQRAARGQSVDYAMAEERDAEYLAAVEAGDMEKAQRMVDEAARAAGYNVEAQHTTRNRFTEFDANKSNETNRAYYGKGFYFHPRGQAKDIEGFSLENYGKNTMLVNLKLKKPFVINGHSRLDGKEKAALFEKIKNLGDSRLFDRIDDGYSFDRDLIKWYGPAQFSSLLQKNGYDGVVFDAGARGSEYVIFNPNQIKSADPVTYDDAGNVIPLSQRFQPESPDIRFSAADTTQPEAAPRFTPDEARAILTKRFGKAVADKFNIEVMAPRRMGGKEVEVDAELRDGVISLNLKFMDNEEFLIQKAEHEMAHAVFTDPAVQDAWRDLSASMPNDVRERITERMREAGYDPRALDEEVLVRFFEEVRAATPPSKWKAFMDAVIDAFRRFFGAAPDERTARVAAARIIAAGEAAVARGLDPLREAFGRSVSDLLGAMDAEYMAAVEAGDMAKAQRMVDEAAKSAGFNVGPVYHHGGFDIRENAVPDVSRGFHLGTKQAAEERAYGKPVDDFIAEAEITYDEDLGAWFWSSQGTDSYDVVGEDGFRSEASARRNLEEFASQEDFSGSEVEDLGNMTAAYLRVSNPLITTDQKADWEATIKRALARGNDSVQYRNEIEDKGSTSYIALQEGQIKSADPVTYDDQGNVIPLSKRFGPSPDIRFSVATPRDTVVSRRYPGMTPLVVPRTEKEVVASAIQAINKHRQTSESKDKIDILTHTRDTILADDELTLDVKQLALDLLAQQASLLADIAQAESQSQQRLDDYALMTADASGVLQDDPQRFASFKFDTVGKLLDMATESGRTLRSWSTMARLTPEGFVRQQERIRRKKVDETAQQQFEVGGVDNILDAAQTVVDNAEKEAVDKAKREIKRRSPDSVAQAAIARLNEMLAGPPRPRGKPSEISTLIRRHLRAPIEGFTDKLTALGVEKETADALDGVAATVRADMAKLEEANAIERLTKSLRPKTRAAKSAIPRLMRVLLEAGRTGAFDSKAFNDALAEAFGFPPMTSEQEKEVKRMVAEINKLPQGAARVDKQQELQNFIAMHQGVPAKDMLLSAWYANVLSGFTTQLIGPLSNMVNSFLRSAFLAITSRRGDFAAYLRGMAGAGHAAGWQEVKAALQGRGLFKTSKLDDPQIANALEVLFRKGPTTPAEWLAYIASAGTVMRMIFRGMAAADAYFWNSTREGMAHLAANRAVRRIADEAKASGTVMTEAEIGEEFIRQLGGGPEAYEAALKAAEETLKAKGVPADMVTLTRMAREAVEKNRPAEITALSNRWADRIVLQQEPEGIGRLVSTLISGFQKLLTPLGFPFGQMLVPFNKIVSNLFEQSIDYTGFGLVRAFLGMHATDARLQWNKGDWLPSGIAPRDKAVVFDDVERRERAMAGLVGLSLSIGAYLLAKSNMDEDDDEVEFMLYASGPKDKDRRDQMPAGWVPFSIKVGDTYYRYSEWPLGMVLAGFASALDAERYGNMTEKDTMNRIGYAAMTGLKGFMKQGVLSSLDTAVDTIMFKAPGTKYTDVPVNAVKGMIPAQGALRDLSTLFDPTKISNDSVQAALLRDLPFVRGIGTRPELNAFGEPVNMEGLPVVRRFATTREKHPVADYLTRNKLYIPGMDETIVVGQYLPEKERDRFKRRAMQMNAMDNGVFTVEQNYNFRKRAGELTKSAVERIMQAAPPIRTEEQRKAVQNLIDRQVGLARRRAMVEAVPYEAPR